MAGPIPLPSALGNYAAGERFFDRQREVADIAGYLLDGQGVLVTGPRRVGKTSVVHRVLVHLEPEAHVLFADVESHDGPAELFAHLGALSARQDPGVWQRVRGWFSRRLDHTAGRVEGLELGPLKVALHAAMAGSWRDDARAIVEALAARDRPTVLAVDELPLLLDRVLKADRGQAELLLGLLRNLAHDFPAVRWLVSGSIGLEAVLHRAALTGTITHLRPYPVDAWDGPTTVAAVEALAAGARLDLGPGVAEAVHDQLGLGVPYHVQVFVDELRRDADRRPDRRVSAADVGRVYQGPFLSGAVRAHLLHLESRLGTVLGEGDDLRLGRDLLTQAAVAEPLTERDASLLAADVVDDDARRLPALRQALEILEHDAYLARGDDGWRFRSRLVRDWWRRGNELGYVPAADRAGRRPPRP